MSSPKTTATKKSAARKKKKLSAPRKRRKSPARKAARKSPKNGDQNVDQIRELLFGEQMTGYEERFAKLEKKLTKEMKDLKATVQSNLRELRKLMRQRANEVESASVPRDKIADSFERLAKTLRR